MVNKNKIKINFLIIVFVPFLLGGSCEKRKFSFLSEVNQVVTYEDLETDNDLYEVINLSTAEIRRALDIPQDGEVTEVFIRGFGLKVIPTNSNTVSDITTSCIIIGSDNLRSTLWERQGASILASGYNEPVDNVIKEGVNQLKLIFEEALLVNQDRSYKIALEIEPGFGFLSADVQIIMDIQVEYEQCIEIWDYLDGGEECN